MMGFGFTLTFGLLVLMFCPSSNGSYRLQRHLYKDRFVRSEDVKWKQGSFLGIGGNQEEEYNLYLYKNGKDRYFIYFQEGYDTPSKLDLCDVNGQHQYGTLEPGTGSSGYFSVIHDTGNTPYQRRFKLGLEGADGFSQTILRLTANLPHDVDFFGLNLATFGGDVNWVVGNYLKNWNYPDC
eukprot:GFUD01008744.1.p1 GENE.GFUD01008744.1~~GFUD01008744.1.p1  ORF type:complete len:181 (-),score=16.85 GFUD01008744.1:138-680(-)